MHQNKHTHSFLVVHLLRLVVFCIDLVERVEDILGEQVQIQDLQVFNGVDELAFPHLVCH